MTAILTPPLREQDRRAGSEEGLGRPVVTVGAGRRIAVVWALLVPTVLVLILLAIAVGPVAVPPAETVRVLVGMDAADPRMQVIIESMRLPRVFTAILAGAGLGVAGLQMQTLFRNNLAEPYVLGVSSGASLGVALVVIVGGTAGSVFSGGLAGRGRLGLVCAAAVGSALVLSAVLLLSRWVRSTTTLLLIGVMVGSASTAMVSVLLVYADPQRVQQYLLWGLGSFSTTSDADLKVLGPVIAIAVLGAATTIRALNALLLGEGYARTMGVDVRRTRMVTLVTASLAAGTVTAFCGPIAFLGLAVPHLARIAFGTSDHRVLLPGVVAIGAAVALACGIVAQVPGSQTVLPVNAVTAAVGAPLVIAVLVRSRRGTGLT